MCYRSRQPVPKAIADAPSLWLGLELYFEAFQHLTTCRNQGYSTEGPISWLAIDEYADRRKLAQDQREDLHYLIPEMDEAYLAHKTEVLKQQLAAQGRGAS